MAEAPTLRFVAALVVEVEDPLDLGAGADGRRRIVPITGGTVRGPLLNGRVLAAGADYQVMRTDGATELEARYALELDDGTRVEVTNRGLRTGSAEDLEALARGDEVDPSRIYFRSAPVFRAPAGDWEWLNTRVFVASGARRAQRVELDVYRVD